MVKNRKITIIKNMINKYIKQTRKNEERREEEKLR